MTWSGIVEPDYFQFYARRRGAEWLTEAGDEVYRNRLWTDGGFVVISTLRKYGTTAITLDVLSEEPAQPDGQWQHVAEVSLGPGGPLEILSWPGDQDPRSEHEIPSGPVRLRVQWGGLVPNRFEGLDEEGNSGEHLALLLWPAPTAPLSVVRAWDG